MLASGNAGKFWRSTGVAQQLGIDYPIIQAPFGGLLSQRLTATVSNLGGLGSLGAVTLGSSAISEIIGEIHSLTSKPFAINLWVSTFDREISQVDSGVIDEKVRALAQYYAELDIEPPSKIEAKPQDFGMQVRAAIDASVPVLSFIYGIPPSEILDECRRQRSRQSAQPPRRKKRSFLNIRMIKVCQLPPNVPHGAEAVKSLSHGAHICLSQASL